MRLKALFISYGDI